ncbi:MAG: 4-vinyl reductase [Chloroflexi bacterium]|nr:4-vinyl reductase [Chloroflexota bacterium]
MPPEKSGYFYPNKFALIILMAMEEIMGKNGLNAILNLAGLSEFINNYPPDNLEKEFDFAYVTALQVALEEMYGPRGGRGLALRAGRATFAEGLKGFGALAGVGDLAFKVLPLPQKLKIGLPAMANILTQFSDQISRVHEEEDKFIYTLERCPMCWKRKADRPVCYIGQGLLQEGLRWVSGGHEFKVDMASCIAKGDDMGRYVIFKEPIG